jgi:hypothetical protein
MSAFGKAVSGVVASVDWGPLAAKLVTAGAPIVGGLIGGPVGTVVATVATAVGGLLDVPATPEAIGAAIDSDPAALSKVVAFERNQRDELLALQAEVRKVEIEQINSTMRAEITAGDRFQRWARPFNMYAVGGVTAAYGLAIVAAAIDGIISKQWSGLTTLMDNGPSLGIALAPAGAVAGVTAWQQTKEKLAGVVQRPPSSAVTKAVRARA